MNKFLTKQAEKTEDWWDRQFTFMASQKGFLSDIKNAIGRLRDDIAKQNEVLTNRLNSIISNTNVLNKALFSNGGTDSLFYWIKLVRNDLSTVNSRVNFIVTALTNRESTDSIFYWLRWLRNDLANMIGRVNFIATALTDRTSSDSLFYWIRLVRADLTNMTSRVNFIATALTDRQSTDNLFYWIRLVRADLTNMNSRMNFIATALTDRNSNDSLFYWVRQLRSELVSINDQTKIAATALSDVNRTDSLFYWVRQLRIELVSVNDRLKIVANALSDVNKTDSLFYWIRDIRNLLTKNKVFDMNEFFTRLSRELKKISFGEIINEAGTNIWDVLATLTKGIFDLSKEIIKGTAEVIKALSDLVGSLISELLGLIVPKDTDFLTDNFKQLTNKFDYKFKSFIDIGVQITDIFKPNKQDFFTSASFSLFGVEFNAQKSKPTFDLIVPKFRSLIQLSIWLLVAISIFKKITGSGDLINDN